MIRRIALAAGALTTLAAAPPAALPAGPGYQPQDKLERGLWMQLDEFERKMKSSNFVVRDPALNTYVRGVLCRLIGPAECAGIRLYIVRTADFNATMAPNGMMTVYTGLLLRMQNEAELAAVLGHEYTHYHNRHTLQSFRDAKSKSGAIAWLSAIPVTSYAGAVAVSLAQIGLLGSHMKFSRAMEAEADAGSIPLMNVAGYQPGEAPRVWEQVRAEQDATAEARRRKSRKDDDGGFFASHPATADRVLALKELAGHVPHVASATDGRVTYRDALRPWWPQLIDDEIKRNDFGGSEFLLGNLAQDGWTPELLYARGELYRSRGRPGDLAQAAGFYRDAIAQQGPAEAWRGLGLAELRSGRAETGREALKRYLTLKPDAADKAMIGMLSGEGQ